MPTLEGRLGVELPILQAPMAGAQDQALAISVSNAGGLGALPCAMLDAATMDRQLTALRAGATAPFAVNFFSHVPPTPDPERERRWRALLAPYYVELGLDPAATVAGTPRVPFGAEAAEVLERFEPVVVSFHFGLPASDLIARVRRWGATVLATATTVEEARWLDERGADIVVAQGLEAGGHRGQFLEKDLTGQLPTLDLVRAVRAAGLRAPVVAAGGISDAGGVVAALAAGAAAAMVGTAYLLCPEATTSAVHRAALAVAGPRRTAITNLFSGRPARGMVNRLMREIGPMSEAAPAFPLAATAVAPLRAAAERRGSGDFSPLWAGEGAVAPRPVPAASLTRELAARL